MKNHKFEKKNFDKQKVIALSAALGLAVIVLTVVIIMNLTGKKAATVTAESTVGSTINGVSVQSVETTSDDPGVVVSVESTVPQAPAATVPGNGSTSNGGTTTGGGDSSSGSTPPASGATATPTPAATPTAAPTPVPVAATVTPAPTSSSSGGSSYVDSSGFVVDAPSDDSAPAPVVNSDTNTDLGTTPADSDDDGFVVFPLIPASEI